MATKRGGHDDINHEINHIRGGRGADDLAGTTGDDSVTGGAGNDWIHSGAGNDDLNGGSGRDRIEAGAGDDRINGGTGSDVLRGGSGADVFVFDNLSGADKVSDFVSGTDKISFAATTLGIGNGDAVVDGAVSVAGPDGFAASAELVIVETDVVGRLTSATAAAHAIGSADSAYAVGDTRVFVTDNGVSSAVWMFESADADATVSAGELTLVATLEHAASTTVGDYVFA